MTKKAPFKSTVAALLLPWLLVQVARAVDPLGVVVMPDGPVLCIKPGDNCQKACELAQLCDNTRLVSQGEFNVATENPSNRKIFAPATSAPPGAAKDLDPQMAISTPGESNSSSSRDGSSSTAPTPASEVQADSDSAGGQSNGGQSANVGAIAGGVVGGVAFLALLGALLFFCLRRNPKSDAEGNYRSVDKSRASSPTSMSPVYGGAPPPPAVAPLASGSPPPPPPPAELPLAPAPLGPSAPAFVPGAVAGYSDRGIMQELPPPQHYQSPSPPQLQQQQQAVPAPQQFAAPPAELHSREVNEDGISVSSFDMERPPEVPRLPVYKR